MAKEKQIAPWIFTGIFILLGLFICAFPSYRFSALISFAVAALILTYTLLRCLNSRFPKFSAVCRRLLSVVVCLGLATATLTGIFIACASSEKELPPCDYLIVLGAGVNGTIPSLTLQERLTATYDYLSAHPDTVCIVSGGQGPGEDITEAACMSAWLIKKGISPDRILQETKATSTEENLAFSMELIEDHSSDAVPSIGIVSSEYHLFRASLMARDQNLSPVLVRAKTQRLTLRINYHLREIAATWYYVVFGN